jgi:hypothetical protein
MDFLMDPDDDQIPAPILRDLFAMAALIGMGTWMPTTNFDLTDESALKLRALWAYAQAEAMIAVRAVTDQPA